ncbi:MAG: GGDEF domain-containing protein [Lachnospiraceae bacterium]|nr:GGDEF domain-containing protein [Lachnospiraceae bacterium]
MKKMNIALFISEFEDPHANTLCEGAVKAAKENGHNLFIFPGKFIDERMSPVYEDAYAYQHNCLFQFISKENIDIAIVNLGNIAARLSKEEKQKFLSMISVPVILISDIIEGYSSVNYDNNAGLALEIEHLIQEHQKKHFGYISGPNSNIDAIQRKQEFEQVMQKNGFLPEQYRIVEGNFSSDCTKVVDMLMDSYPEMDALICANDMMGFGAYQAIEARGLKVGKDIAVVGFDDSPYSAQIQPGLTTVKADSALLGYKAVQLCERVLRGEQHSLTVDTTFVQRGSCGCEYCDADRGQGDVLSVQAKLDSLNHTLVSISRNVLNYEEENHKIYYMILDSLCKVNIQSVYLYTFMDEIEHKKGQDWVKPETVRLQAYYREPYDRIPDIAYQPMPVYYYPVDAADIKEIDGTDQIIPFDRIFDNLYMTTEEQQIRVVTLLYAGEVQYGFMVWDVKEDYFGYTGQLSYQISNALKTNKLLQNKNKMAAALEVSLQQVREQNSILEEISKIDELTQIYNRRGFLDSMKRSLIAGENQGKAAIAIYADMNDLKLVNDKFGHEEGDAALKLSGQILREAIHEMKGQGDVGRIGGDEFCAYLITDDGDCEQTLRNLITDITERMNRENEKPYYVSLSAGMKHFICDQSVNISYELEQADAQLYKYKKNKRKSIMK